MADPEKIKKKKKRSSTGASTTSSGESSDLLNNNHLDEEEALLADNPDLIVEEPESNVTRSFTKEQLKDAIHAALDAVGHGKYGGSGRTENNFSLPTVAEADKLVGRKNYKPWKRLVELELRAHGLISCVEQEDGDPSWDEKTGSQMNAKAQSFLNRAVSSGTMCKPLHFFGAAI